MSVIDVVAFVIGCLLCLFLFYAMLYPEKL